MVEPKVIQVKNSAPFTIELLSENTLMLRWKPTISKTQHNCILLMQSTLKSHLSHVIVDIVASYHCLMVYFKFEKITLTQIINKIEKTANSLNQSVGDLTSNTKEDTTTHHTPEGIRIPVFYDTDQQWDLADVAAQCQLSIEEVIQKHSTKTYQSYAHGFTPGFCYLASLSHTIRVPRKASPRLKVPQGAVAIAEEQTAVYPNESPGGWNIIGQTPLAMYTRDRHDFSPLIALGDRISFYSISKEEFNNIKAAESLKKMKARGAS